MRETDKRRRVERHVQVERGEGTETPGALQSWRDSPAALPTQMVCCGTLALLSAIPMSHCSQLFTAAYSGSTYEAFKPMENFL